MTESVVRRQLREANAALTERTNDFELARVALERQQIVVETLQSVVDEENTAGVDVVDLREERPARRRGGTRTAVLQLMTEHDTPWSVKALADAIEGQATDADKKRVRITLVRLADAGEVIRVGNEYLIASAADRLEASMTP